MKVYSWYIWSCTKYAVGVNLMDYESIDYNRYQMEPYAA